MLDDFDALSVSITVRRLDRMGIDEVIGLLGDPRRMTRYAEPFGYWRQGSPRPALSDERPEVMQAIGRCAAARVRMTGGPSIGGAIHPRPCGWCGFPLEELLAACDWATWHGRHVVSDLLVWRLTDGSLYLREAGGSGAYGDPATFAFWSLSPSERGRRVAAAIAASREGIAA